ncbi:stomatin-like protein 2, mitochondrial [Tanacetum coccineum]
MRLKRRVPEVVILLSTRFSILKGRVSYSRLLPSVTGISRVVDPKLASYGVENLIKAITQLAQPTTRSNLGKITLDKTFEEIDTLNTSNHTHSGADKKISKSFSKP